MWKTRSLLAASVFAPYSGTVRRVKWLGQSPDGSLTASITLMVRNNSIK